MPWASPASFRPDRHRRLRRGGRTYAQIVEQGGGEIRLGTKVTGIERRPGELVLKTNGNDVHTRPW